MDGIDVSHYQKINWDKVKTDFVICKCTESTNYFDPTFDKNKTECRKRGIPFGAYHFARGTKGEAEWFVKNVGQFNSDDLLVLDYEIHLADPVPWCNAFLQKVKDLTGITPLIYLNSSTAKSFDWDTSWPLWIANYGDNSGIRHLNPPTGKWKEFKIHQYTSKGKVAGITGNVDLDYMDDDIKPEIQIMYTPYSQRDIRWRFKFLGNSWSTIGGYGCYLTSLSMMVGKRPDEVNEILKKAGAFDRDFIKQEEAANALGLDFLGREYNIDKPPNWSPSIKEVKFGKSQHFVLRLVENGVKKILDPWDANKKRIDFYPFVSYRKFRKPLP
jgi:lysozyme